MDREQFEKDKTIDPGQLDVECTQQADLFFRYAEQAIKASSEVDRQRFGLKVLEAKLQARVREDPEHYGVVKVTEAAIDAAVKTHPKYTAAVDGLLTAQEVSSLLDIARETMQMKKGMLEALIKLHGQQYFAGPSVPRDLPAAWLESQGRVVSEVNQRQQGVARRRVKKEA